VTTHFLEEAEFCDRLVILEAGEILALDTPEAIRRKTSASTLEEAFIALLETRRGELK